MTDPLTIRADDGLVLFRVQARPDFDEFRDGYLACALRFAGMHDAIAEVWDAPAREPMPTLAELRPPDDLDGQWDCFAEDDEDGWPQVAQVAPVGRARRVMERLVHGR